MKRAAHTIALVAIGILALAINRTPTEATSRLGQTTGRHRCTSSSIQRHPALLAPVMAATGGSSSAATIRHRVRAQKISCGSAVSS